MATNDPAATGAHPSNRSSRSSRPRLVVVGNGMVGQKLLDELVALGAHERWDVVVFGDEPRPAYDRVRLSRWFDGATAEDLSLVDAGFFAAHGITTWFGDEVVSIDRTAHEVHTRRGRSERYDRLVLATGSSPFVPPVDGRDAPGSFVYRTIEDLEAIAAWADDPDVSRGSVVGGGLLGLEAAGALRALGLDTTVVEFAPRLMPVQLDDEAGAALRRHVERLGVRVRVGHATSRIEADDGRVARMVFADESQPPLPTDLVVWSAGIRPRDALARGCGLAVGERGGIVVDDTLTTSEPDVSAIGECALVDGRIYGLVAPGYSMARALARQLAGSTDPTETRFAGSDLSTKLKLLGVEVASFGDGFALTPGARTIRYDDTVAGLCQKLVVSEDGSQVLGGILVGDTSAYQVLVSMARGDMPTPEGVEALLLPDTGRAGAPATAVGVAALAGTATVCSCENVDRATLGRAVSEGCTTVADLKRATRAGTGCGGCVPLVTDLLRHDLAAAGVEMSRAICEHFDLSRQELFDLVRVRRYTSFREVLVAHGRGRGCDVCKPVFASIVASLTNGYVLDGEHASLQDSNDHVLANIQRDGTYSVVPRVPGGEITADGLIAIGEVARDFGLYTKITGGQRIDLFGARIEQLPAIWRRLVDAGFESGHAYGKAVRTVKSCVGETWCRYGVQDSTALAIRLEHRYRGLRAPHKIKAAVSGCARECAEAQSKDVGVIATERGWNLYVGGNGGQRPRHAVLFAEDLDEDTLIRYVDRFLMFYVRTADRLERTATWLEKLDGGVDHLRRVLIDDALGLCADLEADMARHVATYECEWKATLERPERLARFVSFVNAPDRPDPTIRFVEERGQIRPAARRPALVPAGRGDRDASEIEVQIR